MHLLPSARVGALVVLCCLVTGCHEISSIAPERACPREELRILGSGFGSFQGGSVISVAGRDVGRALAWTPAEIRVRLPVDVASGAVEILRDGVAVAGPVLEVREGLACRASLIPGPAEEGFDAQLEAVARRYDRGFHAIHAATMGLNAEVSVALARAKDRELIRRFLQNTDGWDFEAFAGKPITEAVSGWSKVAGFTAGVGLAADAYRYGVLRDQGYPGREVKRARELLVRGIEGLHKAVAITGTPGVVARGFLRTDIPGGGATTPTVPLFDEAGRPLPLEKNNGTWREDNSGRYPNTIWEDSCSRDQFQGWAAAHAAVWEVIRDDPSFPGALKKRLQADAKALLKMLMTVQASGYDLEIQDADGRPTFHAYLNENAYDRLYLPFLPIKDGVFSLMSTGILGALSYAAEAPALAERLADEYLGVRDLDGIPGFSSAPRSTGAHRRVAAAGSVRFVSIRNRASGSLRGRSLKCAGRFLCKYRRKSCAREKTTFGARRGNRPLLSTASNDTDSRLAAAACIRGKKNDGKSSVTTTDARAASVWSKPRPSPGAGSTYGK